MATTDSIPSVSFQNELGYDITIYDSFSEQDDSNYFGTLTALSLVPANSTRTVQPLRKTSVLIASNVTHPTPLARVLVSPLFDQTSFTVSAADEEVMADTMKFISFLAHNPNDTLTTAFQAIWKSGAPSLVKSVNAFFAQHPDYAKCTFQTYMMGITVAAQTPATTGKPLEQATYSLSTLAKLLGGTWPDDFPDVTVAKFTCNTKNETLDIWTELEVANLPVESGQILQNFSSIINDKKLWVNVRFHYGFDLGVFGTSLAMVFETIKIPLGGSNTLSILKPTVSLDINPLFKFVVFTIKGSIPFSVFQKKFDANVSMVIDNVEASIGVVIDGDHASLPAPPVMQGVHFDEFGVGVGVFFEPPSGVIGLQGKFHIGDQAGNVVQLDDDTFVVVCQIEEEVPNPVYASFYVPRMDLNQVVELFTNTKTDLDVPVSFTDMSFKWAENPMEPFVLPDGTLSSMGYGFSGAVQVASFGFYGDVEIDMTKGLTADVAMSPLAWQDVFRLSGDGKGVTIKVDQNGSPLKNNQLRTTKAQQEALKTATDKQLVSPGGPVLSIRTLQSPILHLNGKVSLFELEDYQVEADINKDGIQFELGFDGALTEKMRCTLADFHNLSASFQFAVHHDVPLPRIGGVSLGSIPLDTSVNGHFILSTSLSDISLRVGGDFNFYGLDRTFGDFTTDAHIQKITELLEAIIKNIESDAQCIFHDFVDEAQVWAQLAKKGIITLAHTIPDVLKYAYAKTASEAAAIMRAVGFNPTEIAQALYNTFQLDINGIAAILKNLPGLGAADVAYALQQINYKSLAVAQALKLLYGTKDVALALQSVFALDPKGIVNLFQQIGYSDDDIKSTFQAIGGAFAQLASEIWRVLDPTKWFH